MKSILRTYQTKLTNLTAGNKSLLQLRAYKYADLDIHEFNFLTSEPSIKVVEKLLLNKTAPLCLIDDPRSEQNNLISKRVRQVLNRTKFIQNERGTEDLYLAYPFVEGKLKNGFAIRCPLLFIPVKIQEQKNHWLLVPNNDTPIKLNKSFLLAYAYYHETKLDKVLEELEIGDLDFENLRTFLTVLYEILKNSQLEINFNQELFEEQLKHFHNYKKADFENDQKDGVLKLQPYAVLGIYPQAGSNLFSDYENIIENCTYENLEDYFNTKNTESLKNKEESFFTPLAMDASQEEAIKMLRLGKSIVVQGPPGTGKSQLIAQVIADYLANGKKVLLTCDKRVALDVVYQRLQAIGIEQHIGLVHDYNSDRKNLYEKISHLIENLEHSQNQNNSYNTIALERDFLQISRRITSISDELDQLKQALFDDELFGVSIKYLYLNTQKKCDHLNGIEVARNITFNDLNQLLLKLKYWLPKAHSFEKESFLLKDRLRFHAFQGSDKNNILNAYSEKNKLYDLVNSVSTAITGQPMNILAFEDLAKYSDTLSTIAQSINAEVIFDLFINYVDKKLRRERLNDFYHKVKELINKGIVQEFNQDQLYLENDRLSAAIKLLEKNFGKLRYYFQYKSKQELASILNKYNIRLEKDQLVVLESKIKHTKELIELSNGLKKGGFKIEISNLSDQHTLNDWFEDQNNTLDVVDLFRSLPKEFFTPMLKQHHQTFLTQIKSFLDLEIILKTELPKLRRYLNNSQLEKYHDLEEVKLILHQYFDELCEFDKFTHEMDIHEQVLAYTALQSLQNTATLQIEELKNNVHLSWISLIEEKYPILKSVSTGYIQLQEEELKSALQKKQELSKEIVLLKTKENSYKDLEYNRLGNRTTYRDLHHETTKKKKIKSVRQLFEAHTEEVLQIVPCWMASPETVSAIFPNTEIFDLVVFDEASQCFTEEAIPTLFRGKQILIAGDSKQLAPNDLYRARWEDEDETIDEQTNSLLDLACRYLPQTMLCEHYRSLSYELIHFSNEKFYHKKLRLIPSMIHYNNTQNTLEYVKVYGTWQNQSNYIEAVECMRLIKKHLQETPTKSIGVITFNFKQQELIQELLLEDSINTNYVLPESLFIKNIENVQGDERDIIIFSIGYSPNEDGKMVSSFGSLAMQGGENRLNVAITRAKEKMYLVASILPQQLNTENSKNQGPSLLKEYLQYAWDLTYNDYKPVLADTTLQKGSLSDKINTTKRIPSFGFADLIEQENNSAFAAIITDDNMYYQSRSAKEIHGYVPQTLALKNWLVKKFYSREYFEGKDPS